MNTVFGESGPRHVEVLSHPTRRQPTTWPPSEASTAAPMAAPAAEDAGNLPPPPPAADGGSASPPAVADRRGRFSMNSEDIMVAEAGDHFEMLPTPSPRRSEARTWSALRPGQGLGVAPSLRLSVSTSGSSVSGRSFGGRSLSGFGGAGSTRMMPASQRFAQPLASEGQGSVFPVDMPLSERRAHEVEIIKRFDRLEVNTHVGEFWSIIDARWMSAWIAFVMGNAGPPGPISNENLFVHYSDDRRESMLVQHAVSSREGIMTTRPDLRVKPGLQKVRDYRAVHPLVWYLFREMYTADNAPEICRWKADIYQAEVQATRKLNFCDDMHTKAVYELRKFSAKIKEDARRRS